MTFRFLRLPLVVFAFSCAPALPEPKVEAAQARAPVAPASATAPVAKVPVTLTASTRLMELPIEERPDLLEPFEREGVSGTIALFDSSAGVLWCSDAKRCRLPHSPASTFKIPNSIIAFETGVVSDAETILPWNGQTYSVPEWNQDLSLRVAVRVSCVPCFQDIARRIGQDRMREWVTRLDYGNKDISGGIDRFWLWGGLRISPVEELDFVRRLELGTLPIRELTRETVIDLITLDVAPDFVLRGKTGSGGPPYGPELVGWFVGWVERGPRRVYFATALDGVRGEVDMLKARRRVTDRVLAQLGVLPASAP